MLWLLKHHTVSLWNIFYVPSGCFCFNLKGLVINDAFHPHPSSFPTVFHFFWHDCLFQYLKYISLLILASCEDSGFLCGCISISQSPDFLVAVPIWQESWQVFGSESQVGTRVFGTKSQVQIELWVKPESLGPSHSPKLSLSRVTGATSLTWQRVPRPDCPSFSFGLMIKWRYRSSSLF